MFYKNQIRIANMNFYSSSLLEIPFSYHKIGLILNTSCDNWDSIFDNMDESVMLKNSFKWFIITENLLETRNVLSQYPIEIDSDVIIIYREEEKFYRFYEAYTTGFYTHGSFYVKRIGYWNSSLHLEDKRRTNLSGVLLKAMVVVTQKVVNETFEDYVERSKLSKSDTLHKLKYVTLLKYLRHMYNFSYELSRTNSWGYLHNGSFDGMIGTLQRNETDIGGSPIFFRLERARVVDATIEVWQSRPVFILRHPKHPGGYFMIFIRPLTNRVWSCIVMVLAASSAILCIMLKLKPLRVEGDHGDSSISLAVLVIWSAICQQGSDISRSSTSIKLVMFVTFVFALTIYQYYNATVVSGLLRDPPKTIRTPKDLLRSHLKAGIHDVLYNRDFFKHTTDPVALEMYEKKIVSASGNNFFSLEHGMMLVKQGGFAFLVDNSIAYGIMRNTFNEAELCEAHEVALYPPQNMAAVVKKKSPYKEHFAYGLRKMFESGLMRRIKSVWDEPKPACVHTPDTSLISVSVREFATPLVALLAGCLLATLIMALEILLHKFYKIRFSFN
ncbi:glutamate receptor-like [Pectinophora gossypiella]|uniref:glutamate receptor-like n=1 Tax=Pectinophora gossypiella TaxID=13191 RepID=UPI00214EE522|nr:glutamate receptor-like [Pectinophora gossypiella]